jgi:hypothetical protein
MDQANSLFGTQSVALSSETYICRHGVFHVIEVAGSIHILDHPIYDGELLRVQAVQCKDDAFRICPDSGTPTVRTVPGKRGSEP